MFLSVGGVILPGTVIGDNVIVGAYAVASGNIESNSVYAGNPAKRICSIGEYIKKENKNSWRKPRIFLKGIMRDTGKYRKSQFSMSISISFLRQIS
jgi:maltose O-acetyltransferase